MSQLGLGLPYGRGRDLTIDDVSRIPWRDATFELEDGMLIVTGGRPFTRVDLERLPDDGHRYEIIDGVLYVVNAPTPMHQRVVRNLSHLLHVLCPPDHEVLFAPLAVALADDTEIQPDVVLAPMADFEPWGLPTVPLLAVEVLSPSTRRHDLARKKDRLRRDACPHYWVIDPDEPSVIAWELLEGEYAEVGRAVGEESLVLERPFPVSLTPAELIRR